MALCLQRHLATHHTLNKSLRMCLFIRNPIDIVRWHYVGIIYKTGHEEMYTINIFGVTYFLLGSFSSKHVDVNSWFSLIHLTFKSKVIVRYTLYSVCPLMRFLCSSELFLLVFLDFVHKNL